MEKEDFMIEAAQELASEYIDKNSNLSGNFFLTEELNHIKSILASALQTKWSFGVPGGGFVNRLVKNDLLGAIESADSVNRKAIVPLACGLAYIRFSDIKERAAKIDKWTKDI